MRCHPRRLTGYALPIVLTVLMLLGMGFSLVIVFLNSSVTESRRVGGQLRAFYACDSAIRLASKVTQNVVLANPRKTPEEVTALAMDAVCQTAGGCFGTRSGVVDQCTACEYRTDTPGTATGPDALMPDTANMEIFKLRVFPAVSSRAIQFGAFRDLNALQSLVAISTQGVDLKTGTVASARESFSVASVSPFQLMAFSTGPIRWAPLRPRPSPPASTSMPRLGPSIYAGGALSLSGGGGNPLKLLRAVTTGTLAGAGGVTIWDGNVGSPSFLPLTGPDERRAFSIRTPLKLVASPGRTPGQPASEASTSARWLLEPPGPADNEAAIQAKLAGQADIRIIDGVWFIKPPVGDATPSWPGIPIWSDHAGAGVLPSTAEEQQLMAPDPANPGANLPLIGQADLAARHGLAGHPRRFSYYEATAAGHLIENSFAPGTRDGVGVVSYGTLSVRGGQLVPGFFSSGGGGSNIGPVCVGPLAFSTLAPFDGGCRSAGDTRHARLGLLEGARAGFHDVNAASAPAQSPPGMRENVLPMNFDVAQFITAMLDGARGELGNYFCGVRDPTDTAPCRHFNGIVYITATWPGSLKGLATSGEQPERAPFQGSEVGVGGVPLQPPGTFQNRRRWLPRQLCGAKGLENLVTPARHEGPGSGGAIFPIIGCDPTPASPYQKVYVDSAGPRSGVNAVRIINGRDLTPLLTPASSKIRLGNLGGLTIVSSLPVYIYGDYNAVVGPTADPTQVCPTTGTLPPGCGFPMTMVGGDRTTFVSRVGLCNGSAPGFNDSCARWGDSASPGIAAQTFYTGAFMSAVSPTISQENVESLFRVIQHWGTTNGGKPTLNVNGAMFATGRAYYQAEPQRGSLHPQLEWRYQSALSGLEQPPGAPRFVVGVTSRWRDLR